MKKKASTLSILAAIFALLTCTSLVGLILGIVDLVKNDKNESHKGSVFAIIWFGLVTVLGFIVLMFGGSSGTTTSSVTDPQTSTAATTYHVGDTIHISNSSGEYEFTITNVYETSDRNEFSDKNPQKVVIMDYEYKNISHEVKSGDYSNDELYLSDLNFTMYDADGNALEPYPADTKGAIGITPGHQTTAQMAWGLSNDKNYIEAEFSDNPILGTDCKIDIEW